MRGYVPLPPGMVLGHEGAGRVVEVGPEVSRVKKGTGSWPPSSRRAAPAGTVWREQWSCEAENETAKAMRVLA
jgi:NADPH:quinone reductase-like Zn-dependent oxidoreductase